MPNQAHNFVSAFRFTRSNNKTRLGISFFNSFKSLQHGFFFGRMGRTGNNNRIRPFDAQFFFIIIQIFLRNFRIGLVKLGVACYINFAGVCAQMADIIGINAGLHAETAYSIQHIIPNAVQIAVGFYRFFGNTAVNHHYRDIAFTQRTQKIRPQFCFYRHKNARADSFYNGFRHKRQIQREINNGICFRNNLACHIITANRNCRNQNRNFRHCLADFLYQRAGCYNFTNGRAVNPNTALKRNGFNFFIADTAKALAHPACKAFFTYRTVDEIRHYEEKCANHQ